MNGGVVVFFSVSPPRSTLKIDTAVDLIEWLNYIQLSGSTN